MNLLEHIERYLGRTSEVWRLTPDGDPCPFTVIRCGGQIEETAVFCTVGLSQHAFSLTPSISGEPIRHELLIAAPEGFGNRNLPTLVQQLGLKALQRERAFLRGEVIEGSSLVFGSHAFSGFYSSAATFIEHDDFQVYTRADGSQINLVWMIPISATEIEFVKSHGWSKFEDLLEQQSMDMVDFDRRSAVMDM